MPQSQQDEQGVYVPGYRVAPDCSEEFSDFKIRRCPVANSNRLAPLIAAYNKHQSGLFSLSLTYPKPTCAVIDAMHTLHLHREAASYRAQQRAMKEASNG